MLEIGILTSSMGATQSTSTVKCCLETVLSRMINCPPPIGIRINLTRTRLHVPFFKVLPTRYLFPGWSHSFFPSWTSALELGHTRLQKSTHHVEYHYHIQKPTCCSIRIGVDSIKASQPEFHVSWNAWSHDTRQQSRPTFSSGFASSGSTASLPHTK